MIRYPPFGMLMPERQWSYGNPYRYGFNGKENDNEVKGTGNQQDYGMRIYDPRVGRFLSVDPLTATYPALTPYQFASNNPIEGIDLDGLEYVSSKEVRISINSGVVRLRIENMTTVVKNLLTAYNNDPKNWPKDGSSFGADLSIGRIALNKVNSTTDPVNALDNTPGAPDPAFQAGKTAVEKPTAKSTGQPDKRYKDREVSSASPGGSRGLALVSVAVDVIIAGANFYVQNRIAKDEEMINKHIGYFKAAAADVNYALKNTNLIPKELQTEAYLSDIISVVLSGESTVNNYDQKKGAQILEIGKKIYNTYSIKRKEHTGRLIQVGNLDGNNSRTIMEPNPSYDAEYIKQNPPLGDPPKQ